MTPMRNVSFRITKYPFRFRRFWAFSTLETQRLKQIVRTARLTFEDLTPEERCAASRLEGWSRKRATVLRGRFAAPQNEVSKIRTTERKKLHKSAVKPLKSFDRVNLCAGARKPTPVASPERD